MSILILFLLFTISTPALAEAPIHLGIGENYKIPAQPLETLRIEKKGILQIKDEGSQIILTGKKLGITHLQLGKTHYEFVVLHKYRKVTLDQLKQWLVGKRGPQLKVVNSMPEVHGRLLRIEDLAHLLKFTNENSTFHMASEMETSLRQDAESYLHGLLVKNNLPPGRLTTQPHWRYELPIFEKSNLSLYKKLLSPFGMQIRIDKNSLSQAPMIEIQVFIAHVKKSFMRHWGVQWPSLATAQWIPGGELSWTSLDLSLQALEDQGQGRLLAAPHLVTESNKTAEFHSGGEIPIRTTTQFNNNVQWKRYGMFLKTKVKANPQNNMQVEIDLEMSSLDQDSSGTDVPALTRSHVKTKVNLQKPRPIFLSGFLQQQSGGSQSGLPWLSQIPIFKPLFSSGQIYNRDYELIFILYPRIQK